MTLSQLEPGTSFTVVGLPHLRATLREVHGGGAVVTHAVEAEDPRIHHARGEDRRVPRSGEEDRNVVFDDPCYP